MNLSLALSALVICCLLSLTSGRALDSEETQRQGLLELDELTYNGFLVYSMVAAGSGKNFFKSSKSVSEDCVRTANVTLQSLEKLSIMDAMRAVIGQSIVKVVKHKANTTYSEQVEMVCQNLNKKLKDDWSSPVPNFDDAKAAVELPKPTKNYILEIPAGQQVKEWVKSMPSPFDNVELFRFQMIVLLSKFRDMVPEPHQREVVAAAKAVQQIAHTTTFKHTMDRVFRNTFDDFVKNLFSQGVDKINEKNIESHGAAFVKKLDQAFLDNVSLKEEYSKAKKEAMRQLSSKP